MNCFVMMPFAREFDDVYAIIKASVEAVLSDRGVRCFRLDEARPAGRITERLLREIQAANLCIADLTGNKPNVMWEVGYAMALGKPTIMLTQKTEQLPFDIRDMQSLEYDRNHLSQTLAQSLKQMILDTVQAHSDRSATTVRDPLKEQEELVGTLLAQIQELKSMIGDVVRSWNPGRDRTNEAPVAPGNLAALEGAWINRVGGSHFYARLINNELIVPYCYGSDDELTGVYFGWKKTGDYWFAQFRWLHDDIAGFAFLKQDSLDSMTGAWWCDYQGPSIPEAPPSSTGVPSRWERVRPTKLPPWALRFFEETREHGLASLLTRR